MELHGIVYGFQWLSYGAIVLFELDENRNRKAGGREVFEQGEDASRLYDELDACDTAQRVDDIIDEIFDSLD